MVAGEDINLRKYMKGYHNSHSKDYNYDIMGEWRYLDHILGHDIVVPFVEYQPSVNNAKYRKRTLIESESGREKIIVEQNRGKEGPGC